MTDTGALPPAARGPRRSWQGLRVLVVSAAATHPADRADRRRVNALCDRLRAHGAAVHLLHYPAEADWAEAVTPATQRQMAAAWSAYQIAPVTRPLFAAAAGAEHDLDEWWDPAISSLLAWLFRTHAFDAVLVMQLWLSHALTLAPAGVLRILDTYDHVWERATAAFDWASVAVFRPSEAAQRQAFARADLVWAVGADEAGLLSVLSQRPVLTLPHAEPAPQSWPRTRTDLLRFGIVCAGGSESLAQLRSFLAVAEASIRRTLLPCDFVLAGNSPGLATEPLPLFVRRLPPGPDPAAFFDAVDVVLGVAEVSTDLDAGIADALARGKAVVSLAKGFSGLVPSHRFHTLASLDAVMRACGEIAQVPRLIEDLEVAALESVARATRAADQALADSAPQRPALPRGLVFVVAPDDVRSGSLALDHVCEAARFTCHQTAVAFYLCGDAGKGREAPERRALARLRGFGPVLTDAPAAPAEATAGTRATTLEELLEVGPLALWFACVPPTLPDRLRPSPAAAVLPLAVLAQAAGETEVLAFARRLRPLVASVTATDVVASPTLAALARQRAATSIVPVFWRGYESELIGTATSAAREAVVLFAATPSGEALTLAAAVARHGTRRPIVVVFDDRTGVATPARVAGLPPVPLSRWLGGLQQGRDLPWLAVGIGAGSAFAAVFELFDRAGIPRLELFAPSAAPPAMAGRQPGRAVGVMESALLLAATLATEPQVAALAAIGQARYRTTDDGGWTVIWDLVQALREQAEAAATRPAWTADANAVAVRDLKAEVVLQIQDRGTYRYPMRGWLGLPGDKRPIEAFAVRPLELLLPSDIEYRAIGPQGRETPWVSDAKLCGTRDRSLPLTGFAIRLLPHLRTRYDVVYEGVFVDGRVAGPKRNGEFCVPATVDAPLEAIRVRLLQRTDA